jgi:hypothetical protein
MRETHFRLCTEAEFHLTDFWQNAFRPANIWPLDITQCKSTHNCTSVLLLETQNHLLTLKHDPKISYIFCRNFFWERQACHQLICKTVRVFRCQILCYSFGATTPIWALAYFIETPFHVGLLDLRHLVGLLGRMISSSQGLYLHTNTENAHTHTHKQTLNIYALEWVRTHDPGFRASENTACFRPPVTEIAACIIILLLICTSILLFQSTRFLSSLGKLITVTFRYVIHWWEIDNFLISTLYTLVYDF